MILVRPEVQGPTQGAHEGDQYDWAAAARLLIQAELQAEPRGNPLLLGGRENAQPRAETARKQFQAHARGKEV